MKVSLIIPIYNEEENLKILAEKILALSGFEWEAIFVDDGSRDSSFEILKMQAKADPRFKVISFRKNYGQTAAMSAGFDVAQGEVIVPLDGDLQNDPADILKLLEKINEGYDVVSGWRKNRKDKTFSRKLPSFIANWLISQITKVYLHDYGCSLKAYRREILSEVRLYGEMHRFIPAYAAWHGAKVTEIPVNHFPRIHGKTKYGIGRTLRVVLDLLTVKFLISYSTKPMHFFGKTGIWSMLISFVAVLAALWFKFFGGKTLIQTPLPLIAVMFFLLGIQFILMGLIAEMLTRIYYESGKRTVYNIKEKINLE